MFSTFALAAVSALTLTAGAAFAAGESSTIPDVAFAHEGPFGRFDQFQLQRGLQVYTEVCASCHGLKFVPIRTLSDAGGPGLPEDQVRAYASQFTVVDKETGEERAALATDNFPANTGAGAPDLSLMAKARAGFHGPYGLGINQFFKGMGGAEHIFSIMTGYTGWIAMPPPLADDLVTYQDGHEASVHHMAEDVSAFLMWAAEPKMMARKEAGLKAVVFLTLLAGLLYLTNKRLWSGVKGKKIA